MQAERRTPLTRDRVLRVAMLLADEGGIESVSMRKIAQSLGVEAMSLYNHVANKRDILHGIADLVLSEFELPSAHDDWETAIWRCATSGHDVLVRHPWACNLIMLGIGIRPARLQYLETVLRTFREAGFSPEGAFHAYHVIDSHILGFTLWQLGHTMPGGSPRVRTREEVAVFIAAHLPELAIEDYPYLLEHAEQHILYEPRAGGGEFEFKLRLILEGLKRLRDAG